MISVFVINRTVGVSVIASVELKTNKSFEVDQSATIRLL